MAQERWHIPTCDEELVDCFLEEVGELLQTIDGQLKTWAADPGDQRSLIQIRRCFHTIKGSGRMVKALDLSEVAWKVERMLNQALAGTVEVSEPMLKVVTGVRAQIPRMVDAFRHRRSLAGNRDIETLTRLADTLAEGKNSPPAPVLRAVASHTIDASVRPQDINTRLERCMQRADEALHRSEMALQQARRATALIEAERSATGALETNAELAGLGELAQGLEDGRRAALVRRRFGWLALLLSALVGGLIAAALLLSMPYLG
jgi:chemotaxis protein histidine kinase CheA